MSLAAFWKGWEEDQERLPICEGGCPPEPLEEARRMMSMTLDEARTAHYVLAHQRPAGGGR